MRGNDEEGGDAPDLTVEQGLWVEVERRDKLGLGGGEQRRRRGHRSQEAGQPGNG